MQVNKENNLKSELNGEFTINKKYCFCCNKAIKIYLVLINDKIFLYKDKEKTKLYLEIENNLVLAINRRFRTQEDKNKLSIYYLERENSLIIKELKLKASYRTEMDKWIYMFNKKIKPKRVIFPNFSNNYVKSNDLFHFKNEIDLYVALSNLEYILLKNKVKIIFDIYRNLPPGHKSINTTNSFNEDELMNDDQ